MKNKKVFSLLAIPAMLFFTAPLSAQNVTTEKEDAALQRGWYLGIEGGLPFGVSTFSSFGHDKTHLGWAGGLYGGYRFNSVLSAELAAKYGQMTLTARSCCAGRDYWLGMDGARYNASVTGMTSWNYRDLQSRVNIGQYGAILNVNILGLFNKTRYSRWSVSLSPHVYAVSTKTSIQTIADKTDRLRDNTKWHLGYGGDLQVACHLTRHLQLGIYSGVTVLTGCKMDAMPEYLHKNNFIWESGVRLGFVFGKSNKKAMKEETSTAPVICPEDTEVPTVTEPQKEPVTVTVAEEEKTISFPDIYFAFNQKSISAPEEEKLKEILVVLQENPDMKVTVKGWCDTKGSSAVNKRYSEARAKVVKTWLTVHGIAADRIETVGMGSDFNEADAAKARRASTEKQNN